MFLRNPGCCFTFSAPSAGPNDKLDESQFIIRIGHTFDAANNFTGRFYFNNDITGGLGAGGNIPTQTITKKIRNQNLALNWFHTFSPAILNTLTLGLNRLAHLRGPDQNLGWEDLRWARVAFVWGRT